MWSRVAAGRFRESFLTAGPSYPSSEKAVLTASWNVLKRIRQKMSINTILMNTDMSIVRSMEWYPVHRCIWCSSKDSEKEGKVTFPFLILFFLSLFLHWEGKIYLYNFSFVWAAASVLEDLLWLFATTLLPVLLMFIYLDIRDTHTKEEITCFLFFSQNLLHHWCHDAELTCPFYLLTLSGVFPVSPTELPLSRLKREMKQAA